MNTYTVWALETWGHHSSECCASYSCPCVSGDDEAHDDDRCNCEYTVNDRARVGSIEIVEDASDVEMLRALDDAGYIHAEKCVVVSYGALEIASNLTNRPLIELEAE